MIPVKKPEQFEIICRWIKQDVALWIHVELPVRHYWFADGSSTTENGQEFTEIDFFNVDNDEYVGTISIPGSWMVYALVDKGYFEAILLGDKFYDELWRLVDVEHH